MTTMDQDFRVPPSAAPAVQALKAEARAAESANIQEPPSARAQVQRLTTFDVREQGETLKDAVEQSLNVILDLTLDGKIRWVSPSWQNVVGTPAESVFGTPIANLLLDNETVFADAIRALRADDSGSKNVRFTVHMGPESLLKIKPATPDPTDDKSCDMTEMPQTIGLEAQGIMVYDTAGGQESHTMWMVKPAVQREVTIDLPEILVDSLGVGAEMLAQHLTILAEAGASQPEQHPEPAPVLCRICERQITPWWFPKHTELCLQEHQAEAELQLAQESLTEHRNKIVKVLDALEAQQRYRNETVPDATAIAPPLAEYNGHVIGPPSLNSSAASSRRASPGAAPASRERSMSRPGALHHQRARSFTVRRPLARIVELVLDLCDTALEISTPALKETRTSDDEIRTQSPQSEGRIAQVQQWQSPGGGALDNESGLSALCEDTAKLCKSKVESVMFYRRILEYSERIRSEYTTLVQECIDAALQKASRIAAGEISSDEMSDDSTSREHTADEAEQEPLHESQSSLKSTSPLSRSIERTAPGSLAAALRQASIHSRSPSQSPHRRLSSVISTRSTSPQGCPTPRSHAGALNPLTQERVAQLTDTEAGAESDEGSVRSSVRSRPTRADSPAAEIGPTHPGTSRERKRTSLVLPRAMSISRHPSPARAPGQPQSPLRLSKPRLPSGHSQAGDGLKSPLMSPTLTSHEFHSPNTHPQQIAMRHHRRQSSAASSDILRAPISPHLSMTNNPQPKAVPPSIRDFEIIKPISKGAFGSVYLSKKKSTGDYFAIKALKKADMVAKNQVANVKAERAIMMWQGESDFVAKLYWTFPSKDYIFLVMEYLNGGDCASLVRALGTLPEDWAKRYMAEVVQGVEHLHGREIVHRDLKPDNLLIDQKGHLKLTDFGLSRMGLIGRQKRALKAEQNPNPPDPLKQGPFARSVSMASSRSASFDFQGNLSPGQTPAMTPAFPQDSQPSYFSLSREPSASGREPRRQSSNHASDTGDTSEQLQAAFRRFSLTDSTWENARHSPQGEDSIKGEDDSPDIYPLSKSMSNSSTLAKHNSQQSAQTTSMPPPPMALFDPDDSNRRFVGTPDYLAPETINGLGQDEMSDWWSLGCILFEFLYGYPPFHADTPDQVFENILSRKVDWPEDDGSVSDEAKDLMNRLMCLDPSQRLGANVDENFESGGEEIRKHPWFADVDWETLKDAQPSFVPASDDPENTEYFDSRGATIQDFAAEFEDQNTSPTLTPSSEYPDRPHDALSRVRNAITFNKRGLMPLSIPPHVRENRSRRLSEPVIADDFGQFSFKNLPVLEKANKDVIQKLRAEAMQAQSRSSQQAPKPKSPPSQSQSPPPSLEGSPMLPMPLKRALSSNRGGRSASPSQLGIANPSPSRASQPSSPLVQFSTGQHERRKTSSGSNTSAATGSLQPGSFFDVPRLSTSLKTASSASSPVRPARSPVAHEKTSSTSSPRARSHTVGSNESDQQPKERLPRHQKHRSQVLDISPSSSDNDETRQKALYQVQRRRQNSRRMSQITLHEGPVFRPLDVLICEDHPISRIVMEKLLEKLRCRAIIVNNGAEAMRYAMGLVKFDLIMMEFKLPQVSGADVARMIRETKNANCHTPIVAVTGYLKELQTPNNFNDLIEKPPTEAKFIKVMTRLCHWRPPSSYGDSPRMPAMAMPVMPHSNLRHESFHTDSSPTSTSSGFVAAGFGSSYQGSSREDSISSASVYTDDVRSEGPSSLGNKHYLDDWRPSGLGITEQAIPRRMPQSGISHAIAGLSHQDSAPAEMMHRQAPQPPMERPDAGEYGADDEDEELGINRSRSRSPRPKPTPAKAQPSSKLTTEMLRQDSQGSVVTIANRSPEPSPSDRMPAEDLAEVNKLSATTPPEVFEQPLGVKPLGIEHSKTFQQPERLAPVEEVESEATPRPPGSPTPTPGAM